MTRIHLRPTLQSDLDFVLTLERDPENLPFITPWERTQHEAAIRFPDMRHFLVDGGAPQPLGFLIFVGCRSPHQSLEIKRMVMRSKGRGHGRAALRRAKQLAFDELGAHRLWLDVKKRNTLAQAFYAGEGFVLEGVLRESVRVEGGFESLLVMSMLSDEFASRRAQGLELEA